jgi:hypothetical protein
MRRRAAVIAEDRVFAVRAGLRQAPLAAVQPARKLQSPVPAARRLQQVAADRPHGSHLWRGREAAGLAERLRDLRVDLELAERRPGADAGAVDPARHDLAELDERLHLDEVVAQQRDELGAACKRTGAVAERRRRLVERARS